jgi:hypothetical protein
MCDWLKKLERKQKLSLPVKSMPFHQAATQSGARLPRTCFASAPGMALIEVLVALAVTVVLLGAAFGFLNDLQSMTESVSVMSEVNENLRGSADLITRDFYAAGTSIPIGGIPIPSVNGVTSVKRPGPGKTVFPSTGNGGGGVVLSVITPGQGLSGFIDGKLSDDVTIIMTNERWISQNLPVATITSSSSSGYTVSVNVPGPPTCTQNCTMAPGGAYNVNVGDLMMFSSSAGYALGMVTQVDMNSNILYFAADPLGLDQVCGGTPGCGGTIDSLQSGGVYPPITLTKIDMITYYLDNSNPAHPYSLMRELGNSAPNPVGYGINNLQLTYDLSAGGAGNTNLPSPANPNQISKVNLWLSAISSHALRRSRQYYSNSIASAITLRNLEYVNKY